MTGKFGVFLILNALSVNYVLGLVGGRDPKPEEARYQIVLQWDKDGNFQSICGGGIIGKKYILTAAHCVFNSAMNQFFPGSMRILAGTHEALDFNTSTTIVRDVKKIMIPANYVGTTADDVASNDVAVLELAKGLDLNEEITVREVTKIKKLVKLELPNGKNEPDGRRPEKIMGSGTGIDSMVKEEDERTKKKEYISGRSGKMKVAAASLVDNKRCQTQWSNLVTQVVHLKAEHLCARVTEKEHHQGIRGFCNGDSGSPLVYNKNVVIGVLSVGPEPSCDTNERAAVFAKVSVHTTFISNAMKYDSLKKKQQDKIKLRILP